MKEKETREGSLVLRRRELDKSVQNYACEFAEAENKLGVCTGSSDAAWTPKKGGWKIAAMVYLECLTSVSPLAQADPRALWNALSLESWR